MRRTHGESGTRIYDIWYGMNRRCSKRSHKSYEFYGGRGVSVCREWAESFEAFRDWAYANGYEENLEVDRIDVNGNYEPSNCRWATRSQQNINKRKPRKQLNASFTSRFKGVALCRTTSKWRARIVINGVQKMLGRFVNEQEAALAYDTAARSHFGNFATLNFPIMETAQTSIS